MADLMAGFRFLATNGLNLQAVLPVATLPTAITQSLEQANIPYSPTDSLLLLGHGGRRLWEAVQRWGMKTADPIDTFSIAQTTRFLTQYLDNPAVEWLYPRKDVLLPLQQLGELAGWCHPSPLGSGISPDFGVWFAYRAACLVRAPLPEMRQPHRPSPCHSCADKPCLPRCPVEAVQVEQFDLNACVTHRLKADSPCADRCLSRMACPYFPEHRYSLAQIQYHYGRSLETIRAWTDTHE